MRPVFLKSKMMFPVSLVLITTEIITYSFIADEEVGGHDGMEKYVVSKEFKDLNIGFALDEGLASEDNAIPVFYGERNVFWVQFKCHGTYIKQRSRLRGVMGVS